MVYTIAIDGPAGSGKSTTAEVLRLKLGFIRINSGNLYRTITYAINKKYGRFEPGIPGLEDFVESLEFEIDKDSIIYDGEDITQQIRSKQVDYDVIAVAKVKFIRDRVGVLQKNLISKSKVGVIVEGRDIGTHILPDATLKVYLTASDEVRAGRRYKQISNVSYNDILESIKKRDFEDMNREHGSLRVADNAMVIDNGSLSTTEVVEKIIKIFCEKIQK